MGSTIWLYGEMSFVVIRCAHLTRKPYIDQIFATSLEAADRVAEIHAFGDSSAHWFKVARG